jgi:hypothetical protein
MLFSHIVRNLQESFQFSHPSVYAVKLVAKILLTIGDLGPFCSSHRDLAGRISWIAVFHAAVLARKSWVVIIVSTAAIY